MVRFDGKHWIAKRPKNGQLLVYSYKHIAEIARRNLKERGIVAIPNARPDEKRYEEFISMGERKWGLELIENGKAVYDPHHAIYFVKAQEIQTTLKEIPVTFLAYNVPFEKNLEDSCGEVVLQQTFGHRCILGLMLPSCIEHLEQVLDAKPDLLHHLDFVIGYSGIHDLLGTNEPSGAFYFEHIHGKKFQHPYSKENHSIGFLNVSGGHRTPATFFGKLLSGFTQTLGSRYTSVPEPRRETFMEDFKDSIQHATQPNQDNQKAIYVEALRHKFSIKYGDRYGLPHFK
ncbi:MAG: hypothetical protein AABX16_03715 [Nanoarchaeota archaeon]